MTFGGIAVAVEVSLMLGPGRSDDAVIDEPRRFAALDVH